MDMSTFTLHTEMSLHHNRPRQLWLSRISTQKNNGLLLILLLLLLLLDHPSETNTAEVSAVSCEWAATDRRENYCTAVVEVVEQVCLLMECCHSPPQSRGSHRQLDHHEYLQRQRQ